MLETQKDRNKIGVSPIQSAERSLLDFCPPELQIDSRGSFFLTPPGAYFKALAAGKSAFLQEVGCHCSPPSVPFVTTLSARFHQYWLQPFNHLYCREESRASDGDLLWSQGLSWTAVGILDLAVSLPAQVTQWNCDAATVDIFQQVHFGVEGQTDRRARERRQLETVEGLLQPGVIIDHELVLRSCEWCGGRKCISSRCIGDLLFFRARFAGRSRIRQERAEAPI